MKLILISDPSEKSRLVIVIGILGGVLIFVAIITGIMFYIYTKRNKKRKIRQMAIQKSAEGDHYDECDDINIYHSGGKEVYIALH